MSHAEQPRSEPIHADPVRPAPPGGEPLWDPAVMRARYRAEGLREEDLPAEPVALFGRWFAQTARSGLHEPNAMVVSTADGAGRPSSRTVLLKRYDDDGFVFFTGHGSRKGRDLADNPAVALLFPWHSLARQVLVNGTAERTGQEETAAYFRTRPHGSQLGAWTSEQSTVVASREELDRRYAELAARYPAGSDVPVPPHWGGYRVRPETVEFWQGRDNRLHDRLRYVRVAPGGTGPGNRGAGTAGGAWRVERLSP